MKKFTLARFFVTMFIIFLMAPTILYCKDDIKEVTIRVKSRLYPDFKEDHKVKLQSKFDISDTDLQGVVVEFYADFSIDTLTHKAVSRSDTLFNPAVKILIVQGKEKKEEDYAFPPGLMPHYSAKSFIGFELIDYKVSGKYIKPSKTPAPGKDNEK